MNRDTPFIDTSALIALLDSKDQNHEVLSSYLNDLQKPLHGVVSNLILGELLTFFSRYRRPNVAVDFQNKILGDPYFKVVWIDKKLHIESVEFLKKFSDHQLSFTDASSFALMKRLHLRTALSFDSDFKRAGFVMIP